MKIACIGNLNHQQFILSRYFRDLGHEVTLFLLEEQDNFLPENDTYDEIEGIEIIQLPWKHKTINKISSRTIKRVFNGFDVYCASEYGPAYLFKARIKTDVFIPIGTDLSEYPFKRPAALIPKTWEIDELQFNLFQHGAIRKAGHLFMNSEGDLILEQALRRVGFTGIRYAMSTPYLYYPDFVSISASSPFMEAILDLRRKHDVLIINHGRCEFCHENSVHNKGTNILIHGFAHWVKNSDLKVKLIMLEYGTDVIATKLMIKNLGIEKFVYWLPKCGRKDLFPIFNLMDIAIGNLYHSHWSYNVAMEAAAGALPLIQRGPENPDMESRIYPYIKARTYLDVSSALSQVHKGFYKEIGLEARDWFVENSIDTPLSELSICLQRIIKEKRKKFIFTRELITWILYNTLIRIAAMINLRLITLKTKFK